MSKTFGYRLLLVMFLGVRNFKVRMTVDSINNIPTTVDGIRMNDAVRSHYVVYRSSCKPTQGASKSDIGRYMSIRNIVPWVFFLPECGNYILTEHWGKILESPILHLIRRPKVDISKLIINVSHWSSLSWSKDSSRHRSASCLCSLPSMISASLNYKCCCVRNNVQDRQGLIAGHSCFQCHREVNLSNNWNVCDDQLRSSKLRFLIFANGHYSEELEIEPYFNWICALGNLETSMCKKSEWTPSKWADRHADITCIINHI